MNIPPRQPIERDLLVPFESQNIPESYKEYYRTKRNNLFACIQGFSEIWTYYLMLDEIWLREISDLKPPGDINHIFPLFLFINAHAKMRVSIELVLSGCLAEGRSILRDSIEFVAHAHTMRHDPKLQILWLSKADEQRAFSDAFERQKKKGVFRGLGELHASWGQLSETGSHATLNAICDRVTVTHSDTGGQSWALNYCGVNQRVWATSLFSMLLTCFTMENTFYGDYEDRLKLDHVLVDMRTRFERYKQYVRELLKVRYKIELPPAEATLLRK